MDDKIIEIKNVYKSYDEKPVVKNVSLSIKRGEFVTFLGPSGCGKTTTLRMIAGFEQPTSGQILFEGQDITQLPPHKRNINTVFQKYALFPHLTVFGNIAFGLKLKTVPDGEPYVDKKGNTVQKMRKLTKTEIADKVNDALKMVDLEDYGHRAVNSLSGGQQQRVAIARALVKMPRVLLLDEPLSNLDARLRLQTREEIKRIQRETGITTVFVTHDQEEAMSISDQIVVMKSGVVQQIGEPQQVYDDPVNLFVAKFLGTPPINVFEGRYVDGKLKIGDDVIFENVTLCADLVEPSEENKDDLPGQKVYVGIRPEGFIYDENGPFHCNLQNVEVMGRDVSIITTNEHCEKPTIRTIVDADTKIDQSNPVVSYSLKPHKVFIFDRETEMRVPFEVK